MNAPGGNHNEESRDLSPLELLPSTVFCLIARYLLVVEYLDDPPATDATTNSSTQGTPKKRPYFCHLMLRRGYALAVCSRRCNELMEDSAKRFLFSFLPPIFFLPHVPLSEEAPSQLVQFYKVKQLEVTFRHETKSLDDMLFSRDMRNNNNRDITFESKLLEQVQKLLAGPLVQYWAADILLDCVRGCSRVLRCINQHPSLGIEPDPNLATQIVPVLERIVTLQNQLYNFLNSRKSSSSRLQSNQPSWGYFSLIRSPPDPLSLLWLAAMKSTTPNKSKAQDALLQILDEAHRRLVESPRSTSNWLLQEIQLSAYRELFYLYLGDTNTNRNDDALHLLRRVRGTTKHLDPVNIWTITMLAYQNSEALGLERTISFVSESVDILNSIEDPEELHWKHGEYLPSKWRLYKQNCSTWLREQRRATPGGGPRLEPN